MEGLIDNVFELGIIRYSSCFYVHICKNEFKSVAFVGEEFLHTMIQKEDVFIGLNHSTTKDLSLKEIWIQQNVH